jgi:plasmid replication initiation protein
MLILQTMTKKKKTTVYKSNLLVEARYSLKLCEHRLLLLCIAQIDPTSSPPQTSFRVHAEDYSRQFRVRLSNAYRDLQEAVDSLWARELTVEHEREIDESGKVVNERFRQVRWITERGYATGEGWAELTFYEKLMPYLTNLKNRFSLYDMKDVSLFRTTYAHRIYEWLAQYRKIGVRDLELDWMIDRLELDGKYKLWNDFRRNVLDLALRDINRTSDMDVKYEPIKSGRAVRSVRFVFQPRLQQMLPIEPPGEAQAKIEHAWESQGYRTPGEYREAMSVAEKHGVAFHNARDYFRFQIRKTD